MGVQNPFEEYEPWKAAGEREREEHRRQQEAADSDPHRALLFAMQKAQEYFSGDEDEKGASKTSSPPEERGASAGAKAGNSPAPALRPKIPARHVGRNDPCPCGSGKKFKKCCMKKQGLDDLLH